MQNSVYITTWDVIKRVSDMFLRHRELSNCFEWRQEQFPRVSFAFYKIETISKKCLALLFLSAKYSVTFQCIIDVKYVIKLLNYETFIFPSKCNYYSYIAPVYFIFFMFIRFFYNGFSDIFYSLIRIAYDHFIYNNIHA